MAKSIQKFLMFCGLLLIGFLLLVLFNQSFSQGYKLNKQKWFGLGITAAGGFIDGVVEGYEFDGRKSFERKWGVGERSFFGSKSWEMVNTGWERQFGAVDFYHVADDLRKVGYISGGITIGLGGAKLKQKPHHYLYDFILSFAISGMAKAAGNYYVRHIESW